MFTKIIFKKYFFYCKIQRKFREKFIFFRHASFFHFFSLFLGSRRAQYILLT